MLSRLDYHDFLREALHIDPRHHEFPAWCISCEARWTIYRAAVTDYWTLHAAATAIHREDSPSCKTEHVRIGKPVPHGASAPLRLEEHDNSPFG